MMKWDKKTRFPDCDLRGKLKWFIKFVNQNTETHRHVKQTNRPEKEHHAGQKQSQVLRKCKPSLQNLSGFLLVKSGELVYTSKTSFDVMMNETRLPQSEASL